MVTPAENEALRIFLLEDAKRREVAEYNDRYNALAKWIEDTRALFPGYFDGTPVESWQPSFRLRVLHYTPDQIIPAMVTTASRAVAPTPATAVPQPLSQDEPGPHAADEYERVISSIRVRPRAAARRSNEEVAEKAQSALERAGGPLHINQLVQEMKADGWPGFTEAGSEWAESRQLYRILQGRTLIFRLVGRNVWALIKDDPSPAQPTLEADMT
ncbi:MAG TPA: hypothetical protein DHV93_12690 [Holophagaceae bacterium]|nr:hypothetical protein [Holophagaceae bacterium]